MPLKPPCTTMPPGNCLECIKSIRMIGASVRGNITHHSARVLLPRVGLMTEHAMQPKVSPLQGAQVEHGADMIREQIAAAQYKQLKVDNVASAALPAAELMRVNWHNLPPHASCCVELPHVVEHTLAVLTTHHVPEHNVTKIQRGKWSGTYTLPSLLHTP